jgi:hypothetical protein
MSKRRPKRPKSERFALANKRLAVIRVASHNATPESVIDAMLAAIPPKPKK